MLQLSFTPFPTLSTERLRLRKVVPTDVAELFRIRSDPRAMLHIHKAPATSEEEVQDFIKIINDFEEKNESILWGITLAGEDKLIGTVCFWNIQKKDHRGELGYMLLPAYWGKGIMQEALGPVLSYGFEVMKLHSIEAHISPENLASLKLVEGKGFVREGYFRENQFYNDRYWDTAVYGLLHTEWMKQDNPQTAAVLSIL